MKSWLWPFNRRRRPTIIDCREDNEGWQVGDLAECVRSFMLPFTCPQKGQIFRVADVIEGIADGTNRLEIGLVFEAYENAWGCVCFRKLRPAIEPASDEFKHELKDRLRVREPVEQATGPVCYSNARRTPAGTKAHHLMGTSGETGVRILIGAANGGQWRDFSGGRP